jgi:hypothetical protein
MAASERGGVVKVNGVGVLSGSRTLGCLGLSNVVGPVSCAVEKNYSHLQ